MFQRLTLLLTLTFVVTLTAAVSHRRRPTNPDLGQNQEQIHNLYTQIFGSSYYSSLTYNENYRPPSVNQEGLGPDPTIVKISLKNLKVTDLNDTDQTLTFTVDLIREYTDNRLVYDPPQGIKYIDVSSTQSMWTPGVIIPNAFKTSMISNPLASSWSGKETMLSPEGQIMIVVPVTVTLKIDNDLENEFKMNISSEKWTTEDVEFEWNKELPVQLVDEQIKGTLGTYELIPRWTTCSRTETLGSFVGLRQFSCVQLNLKLVMQQEKFYRITI